MAHCEAVLAGGFHHSLNVHNQGNYFSGSGNLIDDKPAPSSDPAYDSTTAIADHAIDCIKDHASSHTGKPFFHFTTFLCFASDNGASAEIMIRGGGHPKARGVEWAPADHPVIAPGPKLE